MLQELELALVAEIHDSINRYLDFVIPVEGHPNPLTDKSETNTDLVRIARNHYRFIIKTRVDYSKEVLNALHITPITVVDPTCTSQVTVLVWLLNYFTTYLETRLKLVLQSFKLQASVTVNVMYDNVSIVIVTTITLY